MFCLVGRGRFETCPYIRAAFVLRTFPPRAVDNCSVRARASPARIALLARAPFAGRKGECLFGPEFASEGYGCWVYSGG